MKSSIYYFLTCIFMLTTVSCKKVMVEKGETSGDVTVYYVPVVDQSEFVFNRPYVNAFGEPYNITSFKFYIHSIDLIKPDNSTELISKEYFLIDASNSASTALRIKAPANEYKGIEFTMGVDSADNVSGAQAGALDPANGMFWTWNTGYIMAKFEGTSSASNQPNQRFEYHIGGFKGPDNVVKRIILTFPNNGRLNIGKGKTAAIQIHTNAAAWFNGNTPLPISNYPVCMTPGVLANSFASNYSKMFTVSEIENN